MKKSLEAFVKITAICVILFTFSCGDDDPGGPDRDQECVIMHVDFKTFSYQIVRNAEGLPIQLTYTKYEGKDVNFVTYFEYDDSKRLKKLGNGTVDFTYEYDELNRIISENYKAKSGAPYGYDADLTRTFTYNEMGQLDSAYYAKDMYERFVYDESGNLIKRIVKNPDIGEFLAEEYLTFDDKKNPFSEFRFSHKFYVNQSGVYHIITAFNPIMQQFNVTRQKLYGVTNDVIDITHSYTYNDSGYPIAGDQIEEIGYECE